MKAMKIAQLIIVLGLTITERIEVIMPVMKSTSLCSSMGEGDRRDREDRQPQRGPHQIAHDKEQCALRRPHDLGDEVRQIDRSKSEEDDIKEDRNIDPDDESKARDQRHPA